MKKMGLVMLLIAITFFSFKIIDNETPNGEQGGYSQKHSSYHKNLLDRNLGEVKADVTEKEYEKMLFLIGSIEEKLEERKKKNEFFPDDQERKWREKLSDLMDEVTERAYPEEADVLGFDEQEEEKVPRNNEDRIRSYFKKHLGLSSYLYFRHLYGSYMRDYEEKTYDDMVELLKKKGIEKPEFYLFLLMNYGTQETKAVFRVGEDLDLLEEPLFDSEEMKREDIPKSEEKERTILFDKVRSVINDKNLRQFDYIIVMTDGEYNNLASVMESPDGDGSGKRWLLHVDPEDMENEFIETLVHEYGHYLTLNQKEVEYKEDYDLSRYCEEGMVALEGSVIDQFYQRFWKDYRVVEFPTGHMFYVRNRDSFVSDYAATEPAEDIAESFLFFVKEERPEGKSVRDEKLRFFYEFPHLVEIRNEIRSKAEFQY